MPLYEYICQDCKKEFSRVLTLAEYERGEVECPHCKSKPKRVGWLTHG